MKNHDVTKTGGEAIPLPELRPGMCIVLYTDKGPTGATGQCMSTTCPWASLLIYPDYDTAREDLESKPFRRGSRADVRVYVVDDWGQGRLNIGIHEST